MLLCGGLASAQTPYNLPAPPAGAVVPIVHTGDTAAMAPLQPGFVQPAAYQPFVRPPQNTAAPDEGFDPELVDLELPSDIRVTNRLESEAEWQQRIKQHERDRGKQPPLFPDYPVLSSEKYYGRQWGQHQIHPEPNYVVYGRLYFEQKNFERQGWDLGPISPIVETLMFGYDMAALPYHMGTDPLRCYEASAGYCMPGDPTPLLLYPEQWSITGAVAEVGTIFTLIAAFP